MPRLTREQWNDLTRRERVRHTLDALWLQLGRGVPHTDSDALLSLADLKLASDIAYGLMLAERDYDDLDDDLDVISFSQPDEPRPRSAA